VQTSNGDICKSLAKPQLVRAFQTLSSVFTVSFDQTLTMKKILFLIVPLALIAGGCATHSKHASTHPHPHGPGCGHLAVTHDGHTDYLDNGHLHHSHGGHVDEHVIAITAANPATCTPGHGTTEQPAGHVHAANCGHTAVPHGDHTDYVVNGHLHHPHGDHCDNHGAVTVAAN
jgi:hypothetical protein